GERRIVALLDGGIKGVAIDVGDGQRVELGMPEQARRAAGGAAPDSLRHVAAAIAAEAGHGFSRTLRRRSQPSDKFDHGVSRSQRRPAMISRALITSPGSIAFSAANASSSGSSA